MTASKNRFLNAVIMFSMVSLSQTSFAEDQMKKSKLGIVPSNLVKVTAVITDKIIVKCPKPDIHLVDLYKADLGNGFFQTANVTFLLGKAKVTNFMHYNGTKMGCCYNLGQEASNCLTLSKDVPSGYKCGPIPKEYAGDSFLCEKNK